MTITYMGAPLQAKQVSAKKARNLITTAYPDWSPDEITKAVDAPWFLIDLGHGRIITRDSGAYAVAYTGK